MNITFPNGREVPLETIRRDFEKANYFNNFIASETVLGLCKKVEELAAQFPAMRTYGQQLRGDEPTPHEQLQSEVEGLQQLLDECVVAAGSLGLMWKELPQRITELRAQVEALREKPGGHVIAEIARLQAYLKSTDPTAAESLSEARRKENETLHAKLALWQEYHDFVNEAHLGAIQLAYVHGWKCPSEDVEKGREYRVRLGVEEES